MYLLKFTMTKQKQELLQIFYSYVYAIPEVLPTFFLLNNFLY